MLIQGGGLGVPAVGLLSLGPVISGWRRRIHVVAVAGLALGWMAAVVRFLATGDGGARGRGGAMFVAILGDRRTTLPADWTSETAVALAAEATFDATGGAGAGASLTFIGLGGDLVVRVPPGSRVREGGLSLLGDRDIEVTPGDGPEIQIKVYGLFSDVKVTDKPG
jgi:hypothetical protein